MKRLVVTSHVMWQKFSRISWQCHYVFPCGEASRLQTLSRIMWQGVCQWRITWQGVDPGSRWE
jgi:hypothetical protein